MDNRNPSHSFIDGVIMGVDKILRLLSSHETSTRANPGQGVEEAPLSVSEKKHISGLMRVNHAGEVCAQALYYGHAFATSNKSLKAHFLHAADEEEDHLAWCSQRLQELGSHTSYLNPLWFSGAFMIGATAGFVGDDWGLGFVAETEKQVSEHLSGHLKNIPACDKKTKAILTQMQQDELKHRDEALQKGARNFSKPIKMAMRYSAKMMTGASYYL